MKILLAVDSTPASEAAVAEVAVRPWPQGTAVEVVSAADVYSAWDAPGVAEAIVKAADGALRAYSERIQAAGMSCTSRVLTGDPKVAVIDYAAESGADFVIVGSHEASDAIRFLLGSVARAVVRHAPCSVEIVRQRSGSGAMKVMLATDGSDFSLEATRSVASRPWPPGSEFRVVSVAELPPAWFLTPYPAYLNHKAMEELRAKSMQRAEEAIVASEAILVDAGFPESATVAVPSASPQEVIVAQAAEWGADLIVLGSHGRRGATRFLLGSVAEPVAFHATCSVEIIRARK